MIIWLLALIDVHTIFVLMFHSYLSPVYVFAGSSFLLLKGSFFFLTSRDLFSFLDIVFGLIMLFLLVGPLWSWLSWTIGIYLFYKIVLSFAAAS